MTCVPSYVYDMWGLMTNPLLPLIKVANSNYSPFKIRDNFPLSTSRIHVIVIDPLMSKHEFGNNKRG
jgi:hypothetical protein